jgi:hypothetical protein
LELLQIRQVGAPRGNFDRTIRSDQHDLNSYYERISTLEQVIAQAEALKEQISDGGILPASAGDTLAILLARANAFNLGENVILQPDLVGLIDLQDSPEAYVSDLDQIIRQAEDEKIKAEGKIQELSEEIYKDEGYQLLDSQPAPTDPLVDLIKDQINTLGTPNDSTPNTPGETSGSIATLIEQTSSRIQALNAELENQKARELELSSDRDIAWEAYLALSRKATELKSAGVTGNNVTIASRAVQHPKPISRNILRNSLIAGIVGIMLGIIWIIFVQWWKHS